MKSALMLLGALVAAGELPAGEPTIRWISDSYESFDVVLSGQGPGWSGNLTSPSDLWHLSLFNVIQYPSPNPANPSQLLVCIDNGGTATFLGRLPADFPAPDPSAQPPFNTASLASFGGYEDLHVALAPIDDGNPLSYGYLRDQGWCGTSTISITSIPNINNVSTWTWMAEYDASGPSLAPEPGTISIFALAATVAGARRLFKRREASVWAERDCW